MLISVIFAVIVQTPAGPLDAFKANLSSVNVAADFDCTFWYNYNPANLKGLVDFEPSAGPAGEPAFVIRGRWEHGESTERHALRVVGGSKFKPESSSGPLPSVEALFDDELYVYHYLKKGEVNFRIHLHVDKYPTPLVGPFTWYASNSLDREIKLNYAGKSISRGLGEKGGRHTVNEVYQRTVGVFTVRDEVAFDPSVGFLPRFTRGIAYGMDRGRSTASVMEFYLIDARPCIAGGFIPTEWYSIRYDIDDFANKYPGYDEKTKLAAPRQSTVVHFRVSQFEDKKDEPRLEELTGVHTILAPGGSIVSKIDFEPMSLAQIKARVGAKMTPPEPSSPAKDR